MAQELEERRVELQSKLESLKEEQKKGDAEEQKLLQRRSALKKELEKLTQRKVDYIEKIQGQIEKEAAVQEVQKKLLQPLIASNLVADMQREVSKTKKNIVAYQEELQEVEKGMEKIKERPDRSDEIRMLRIQLAELRWQIAIAPRDDEKKDEDPYQGRYHPLLPTAEQAQAHPEEVFSDHLFEVMQHGEHVFGMWNLLMPDVYSGYEPYTEGKNTTPRAERLTDSIFSSVGVHKMSGLSTQEYWFDAAQTAELLCLLQMRAQREWHITKTQGKIPCAYFSTEKPMKVFSEAELQALSSIQFALTQGRNVLLGLDKIQILVFSDHAVVNLHAGHSELAGNHTYFLQTLLQELRHTIKTPIYVLGDANVRVLHQARVEKKEVGVTVAGSPAFNGGVQGVDFGHVGLVSHPDGKIEQLHSQIIDPRTADVFVSPGKPQHLTEMQEMLLKESRPVLTLGTRYQTAPVLGDFSIQQYNKFLETHFGPYVGAHIAMNGFSEVGLYLTDMPDEVNTFLSANAASPIVCNTMRGGEKKWVVPLTHAGVLHGLLMRAYVEVYKPKIDKETQDKHAAASQQKKGFLGGFFGGHAQQPALLPDYHFKLEEILPQIVIRFQNAMEQSASNKAENVHILKKPVEEVAEKNENYVVRIYAELLLAEYMLTRHEKMESVSHEGEGHLKKAEELIKESGLLFSQQECDVLHAQIQKMDEAASAFESVGKVLMTVGMLVPQQEKPVVQQAKGM